MKTHQIIVYTLSSCLHCRKVCAFLDKNSFSYEHICVDKLEKNERNALIRQIKKNNPRLSFPMIVIDDDTSILGFKENILKEKLGL